MKLKQRFEKFKEDNRHLMKEQDLNASLLKRFARYQSIPIAKFIHKHTSLTPNSITYFILLIGLLIAYLFYRGDHLSIIIAGILLTITFFLDYVDGTLARIKDTVSRFGAWIDIIGDEFRVAFIFLAIALGLYRQGHEYLIFIFAFLASTSLIMRRLMYVEFAYRLHPQGFQTIQKEKDKFKFIKDFFYEGPFITFTILIGSLFNILYYVMLLFGIMGWLYCFAMFYKFAIVLKKRDREHKAQRYL